MSKSTTNHTPPGPDLTNASQVASRREFLGRAVTLAATAAFSPTLLAAEARPIRTAVDPVPLGSTDLKLSRLGFGTGSLSGRIQRSLGQPGFNRLIRYAFERGITWFDCSETYVTFPWIAAALKGLPREKLFLQSKISGQPQDVLKVIDRHRKVLNTDYIDSLLIHCMVKGGWTDQRKREMDAFQEAKARKWIRAKGVSCHSLPALRAAAASDWPEVHLVRVNPQAKLVDGPEEHWNTSGASIAPVIEQIKIMHAKGRGVIGMKIIGEGNFKRPEDREKSIRFAMAQPEINAVVIGFKSRPEIDEAIERINRALRVAG